MEANRFARSNASRYFIAAELSLRGYEVAVRIGKTDAHIFCSNIEATKNVNIRVSPFVPGSSSCSVGIKAEQFFGNNYFWVLAGIPNPGSTGKFEYYIIPNQVMAENVPKYHRLWLETPGSDGLAHNDTDMRVVYLPPSASPFYWDISQYRNNWGLIAKKLT